MGSVIHILENDFMVHKNLAGIHYCENPITCIVLQIFNEL